MFRAMTSSMEEREELIKNSMSKEIAAKHLEKCESLEDFYHYSRQVKNGVLSQMELFILNNYKTVPLNIWNKETFKIKPHLGKDELLFGKRDEIKYLFTKHAPASFREREKRDYDKSVKITSISFTLDYHDGDFSVNFNDGAWAFLGEKEVVSYYYSIKNYLDYVVMRKERNDLRDTFEASTNFLGAAKMKKRIEELDKKLSRYEK